MNLRVVLVEPMYDGNIGSVARSMKNFAASFQDAATSFIRSPRFEYCGISANAVSIHETKIKDELARQDRGFWGSNGKVQSLSRGKRLQ